MFTKKAVLGAALCMAAFGLQTVAAQDKYGLKPGDDPNLVRRQMALAQIRRAWDRQSAMFHNARYRATHTVKGRQEPGTHEYLVDREGFDVDELDKKLKSLVKEGE
jgi:hypothetical protein